MVGPLTQRPAGPPGGIVFDVVAGLPLHPLVVHAAVVLVPVAALVIAVAGVWPRFRRWAGYLPAALAVAALVVVPVATQSGEALQSRLGDPPFVERHADLGEALVPWVVALAVVGGMVTAVELLRRRGTVLHRGVVVVVAVAAVAVGAGAVVQTVLVGHSGATAVWSDVGELPAPAGD
ncbi:hypothetical protein N866_04500 [Actinotalea ferrariae CF5-4]|uniref:DUF2231 domain-containing protein n=1 Tax=Actinotalea ferrariae CF5-4 TaxID=948458 RepID=A0A021VP50_9CELL|nr:hypothetical protein N866_04500 [Actinotalea ferrariae CF5-4]